MVESFSCLFVVRTCLRGFPPTVSFDNDEIAGILPKVASTLITLNVNV